MFLKLFVAIIVLVTRLGEFLGEKLQEFLDTYRILIIFVLTVIGTLTLVMMVSLNNWADWTGFGKGEAITIGLQKDKSGDIFAITTSEPGKTLWDWLSLLGVPLSIAALGIYYQQKEQKRIADDENEEILQTYYDRLSSLLIDKNLLAIATRVYENPKESVIIDTHKTLRVKSPIPTDEERELVAAAVDLIRARTLSILRRFKDDPTRKEDVIRFLLEAGILSKAKLNLSGADLSGANLNGADLSDINLSGANLSDTKLNHVKLRNACLFYTKLNRTRLGEADLSNTDLRGADLRDAFLFDTNLSDADLRGARVGGQHGGIEMAKLCRTNLPKSFWLQSINGNRDCKQLGIDPEIRKHTS